MHHRSFRGTLWPIQVSSVLGAVLLPLILAMWRAPFLGQSDRRSYSLKSRGGVLAPAGTG